MPWVLSPLIRRQPIAGPDARLVRRRADQRPEHRELLALRVQGHLHPHAAELLVDGLLETSCKSAGVM